MQFRKEVLDNGLHVVAECDDSAHTTALGFFVNTGARDESDELSGVSHFLEHMLFKGTPSRSAEDVNREFDEMGAHYNAFTSEEHTVYYAAVLPELQNRVLDLLGDILRPSLREEDFETEKQVIVEEIKMYADQPPFCGDDRCKALYFGDHPLGRSILGTAETVTRLTASQMRDYFLQRYSPSNITLAAAGKVDFASMVEAARKISKPWERREVLRELPVVHPRSEFELINHEPATQQYTMHLAAGPAAMDQDRYAAKVLTVIVGDDTGSRMYWDLIDPGKVDHVSLGHHDYQGAGIYMMYMSCHPDQTASNLEVVDGIYRQIELQGIEQQELDQAKSKINSRVVLASEKPRNRLFAIGGNWIQRREYKSVQEDLAIVDGLTVDDIHSVLEKFPLSQNTTLSIGPLKSLGQPSV